MTIDSRVGFGTCVALWLPQADEGMTASPGEAPESARRDARGIALLVEDEPLVRASVAEMLSELGYDVVEAASATEALERLAGGVEPALLVADHLMAGMTGSELVRAVRSRMPGIAALVISGHEVDAIAPDLPRLTKPFRQEELAALIASLDGAAMPKGH
jgi:CheY-like chemotaxis protein